MDEIRDLVIASIQSRREGEELGRGIIEMAIC